jgi:hypothetical protein
MHTTTGSRARQPRLALTLLVALVMTSCGRATSQAVRTPPTVAPCTPGKFFCRVVVPFTHSGKPGLQFNGDSLTVQTADEILARWGRRYDVAIDAGVGTTTYGEAANVAAAAHAAPHVEVIELGTNDALCPTTHDRSVCGPVGPDYVSRDVTNRLQHFADEFPASTCSIFVVPDDHNPSWNPSEVRVIDAYERTHFAHVADWQAAYRPSYFDTADQPHPNAQGRQKLLDLIDAAMKRC